MKGRKELRKGREGRSFWREVMESTKRDAGGRGGKKAGKCCQMERRKGREGVALGTGGKERNSFRTKGRKGREGVVRGREGKEMLEGGEGRRCYR